MTDATHNVCTICTAWSSDQRHVFARVKYFLVSHIDRPTGNCIIVHSTGLSIIVNISDSFTFNYSHFSHIWSERWEHKIHLNSRCISMYTVIDNVSRFMSPPRREGGIIKWAAVSVCLSVCPSVCPVPQDNSRTERPRKPEFETYIEVKVTRRINAHTVYA